MTECTQSNFEFHALDRREVVARFDGGDMTTDAGGLLVREVDRRLHLTDRLATCFRDHRRRDKIEHTVRELAAQRVYGLVLGYEDLNDHDQLRADPLLAVLVGKAEPKGTDRRRARDQGKPGAGKSTLNRLELTPAEADAQARYKKIVYDSQALDRLLVELFLEAQEQSPERIVLDVDATDDPVHGNQEGRFFHGYYGNYCYLPLYILCGEFVLCARLREFQPRCLGGSTGGSATDRGADPGQVAGSGDCSARRRRLLPGRDHELVRRPWRGLCVRPGEKQAAGQDHRTAVAASQGAV
jgi:hypothetical protein